MPCTMAVSKHNPPTLETGVGGPALLHFVSLEVFCIFPPFPDIGVWCKLLTISLHPGPEVGALFSVSQLDTPLLRFNG